ncbi:MAG TPA: transglycosylase SLT domain-containing protein [Steroidobacteraceae bacterium]|nr:transglycosylase SLT domain-containing protein [Steroidobacteraceae bacterium]
MPPPALERDVRFWVRVYTEVTTDGGLLHDDWNLGLVYEVLRFDAASSPRERERRVEEAKTRYTALLKRFAAGDADSLSLHERRILHEFGENPRPRDFLDAIDRIRFQLGQADRFREGLIRAAVWEKAIARTLEQHGVPPQIAALPHVESSFNLAAYSKVGAAGLWQFMPATARRFMRVDGVVDQRLDPYSATEAAANLMLYNYHLLGTWPLAVTAYNHGPGGLKHAEDELGTSDIAVIVKHFNGATFGFASRNFYVSFLAALEVERNADKFFGPITRLPDTESCTVDLPDYVRIDALARAFKVNIGALKVLNPALRPPVWSGSRFVPRGYALRLPGNLPKAEIEAAWQRVPGTERYVAQRNDGSHRVRRNETLAGIAAASGVSMSRLLATNGWGPGHTVARGDVVRIPLPASRGEASGAPTLAAAASSASAEAGVPAAALAAETAAQASAARTAEQVEPLAAPVPPPPRARAAEARNAASARTVEARSAAPARMAEAGNAATAHTAEAGNPPAARTAPAEAAPSGAALAAAPVAPAAPAHPSEASVAAPVARISPPREPVTQSHADSALSPVASPTGVSDTTDYGVRAGNIVIVQADETLGHYADWAQVSSQSLRALNKLHKNAVVTLGHRVKLDLSRVSAQAFAEKRRAYHQRLQEDFFDAHRIAGTESYTVKRGDSVWVIAQQHEVPVWLVAQYNPDVNFADMKPGETLAVPRAAAINRE